MMKRDAFWHYYSVSTLGKREGNSPRDFARLSGWEGDISDAEEKTGKPDACTVDIEKVKHAFYLAWSQVAYDMERNARIGHFKLTNLCAVEVCMDCGGLQRFDEQAGRRKDQDLIGKEADALIDKAMDKFGYDEVLKYIAKHLQLV